LLAAGLLAALLGALVFVTVVSGIDDRQEVLAVSRPVAAGDALSRADLRVVKVSVGKGAVLVRADSEDRVVGRVAAVPLAAGSLLVPTQLGSTAGLAAGQAAVGLFLEPGRFPPGLRAGDRVAVVDAPSGPVPEGSGPGRLGVGVVEGVEPAAGTAGLVVRVRLAEESSGLVAAEGAARRVAVVLLPSEGSK
jgi:hypothetical protein